MGGDLVIFCGFCRRALPKDHFVIRRRENLYDAFGRPVITATHVKHSDRDPWAKGCGRVTLVGESAKMVVAG